MEFVNQGKHSYYHLSLDSVYDTICIKAESELQIQNSYSKVFVFKKENLRIIPNSTNSLIIWALSEAKSLELECTVVDYPFYVAYFCDKEYSNKFRFTCHKISALKAFIQSLFKESSDSYTWHSVLDGNAFSVSFNDYEVQVNADDPVVLSKFFKKLLNWAQIPIVVSSFHLDDESFRRIQRFWVQELINAEIDPIGQEILEIKKDENDDIGYFDQEFLDYLIKVDTKGVRSAFCPGFIQYKIQQVIQEFFATKGASQQDIDKTIKLVAQVMKNPDVDLLDSIVFKGSAFSNY